EGGTAHHKRSCRLSGAGLIGSSALPGIIEKLPSRLTSMRPISMPAFCAALIARAISVSCKRCRPCDICPCLVTFTNNGFAYHDFSCIECSPRLSIGFPNCGGELNQSL